METHKSRQVQWSDDKTKEKIFHSENSEIQCLWRHSIERYRNKSDTRIIHRSIYKSIFFCLRDNIDRAMLASSTVDSIKSRLGSALTESHVISHVVCAKQPEIVFNISVSTRVEMKAQKFAKKTVIPCRESSLKSTSANTQISNSIFWLRINKSSLRDD